MRKVLDFVKSNKAVIIIVVLIIVLVGTIYFTGKSEEKGKTYNTISTVTKTDTELRLEKLLSSIDGVGDTEVMVRETDGKISGVVIVCQGAESITTKNNILNAVSVALNIDKKNIAIYLIYYIIINKLCLFY